MTQFARLGYEVIDLSAIKLQLSSLRNKIFDLLNCVSLQRGYGPITCDDDILKFRSVDQQLQFQCVRLAYNLPELYLLGGSPFFRDLLIDQYSFQCPIHSVQPLLRMDMPVNKSEQSLFPPHQDYVYSDGSLNSVTFWLPLQDVDTSVGPLQIAPGSHLERVSSHNIYPHKEGIIDQDLNFSYLEVPLHFGQGLVFHQKIVHKSGINYSASGRIRFSVQMRFSDASCQDYIRRGLPVRNSTKFYVANYSNYSDREK